MDWRKVNDHKCSRKGVIKMANISTKSARDSRDVHDLTFYKFAIESLPVAVMTVDPELRITGFNSSAEESHRLFKRGDRRQTLRRNLTR